MKRSIFVAGIIALVLTNVASAQWFGFGGWRYVAPNQCANGQCASSKPNPKPEATPEPPKAEEAADQSTAADQPEEVLSVSRARFTAASLEIADACDAILDRLEARYGTPRSWQAFPVYFRRYTGNGVAGYTQYSSGVVREVVVYESLENAVGGTLDHELTHAFFFYLLQSNFDLFFNEGLAQNSEYRSRETLRQTVYRRYSNGEFCPINNLYGRNSYDGSLLIYHEGFSVVDFLIARGGSIWMAAFIDELTRTNNINATLSRFYGYKTLEELQAAWTSYIERGQDRLTVGAVK